MAALPLEFEENKEEASVHVNNIYLKKENPAVHVKYCCLGNTIFSPGSILRYLLHKSLGFGRTSITDSSNLCH